MAFYKTPHGYLLRAKDSRATVGLVLQAPNFGPRLYFVYRAFGGAVGVLTPHIDDISGRDDREVSKLIGHFSERLFGDLKIKERDFVHAGMEFSQDKDFSAPLTHQKPTDALKPIPTTTGVRAARQRPLTTEKIRVCQCRLGKLRWLASLSRPDICARLAHLVSRVNSLSGCDISRANGLLITVRGWQRATTLKYRPGMHLGSSTLAGWPGSAREDQTKEGLWRLGYLSGLLPSSLPGPFHVLQWPSQFTRKTVKTNLGGGAYAFSEMIAHADLSPEFHTVPVDLAPGMAGLEDCDSLLTHPQNRHMITWSVKSCPPRRLCRQKRRKMFTGNRAREILRTVARSDKWDSVPLLSPTKEGARPPGVLAR